MTAPLAAILLGQSLEFDMKYQILMILELLLHLQKNPLTISKIFMQKTLKLMKNFDLTSSPGEAMNNVLND